MALAALNLMATAAGAYCLISMEKQAVRLEQTSEELSRLRIDLALRDHSFESAGRRRDLAESTLSATGELVDLAQKIKPVFVFKIEPTAGIEASRVTVTFTLENRGPFRLRLTPRHAVVTEEALTSLYTPGTAELLNEPLDASELDRVMDLDPGETRSHTVTLELRRQPEQAAYYQMAYEATTDPNVVAVVRGAFAALSMPFDASAVSQIVYRYGALRIPQ